MGVYPDIAIIGVAKGGTTALASWFDEHPQVAVSRIKEPNFYSTDIRPESFSDAYRRMAPALPASYWSEAALAPAHQDFVRDAGRYARLFAHAMPEQHTLEASTSYFFSSDAPSSLFAASPNAHVILMLRHPVERAFSHFRMARRYGMIQGDFLAALAEDAAFPSIWGQTENFVHLSRYAESLRRWQTIWPSNQLHIRIYEEFFANETEAWEELCAALGLDTCPLPAKTKVFEGSDPAYPVLQGLLMQHPWGQWLKQWMPDSWKGSAKQALASSTPLRLTPEEREAAWGYFSQDLAECETLLNRPLSLWT